MSCGTLLVWDQQFNMVYFFNVCMTGSESLNKPIPGPRMPDGTKGFTMGRGRTLPLQKSEKAEE